VDAILERPDIRAVSAVAREVDGVLVVLTWVEDATIIWASPGLRGLLGYDPEEVGGRTPFEFTHPDDVPHARRDRAAAADGETMSREYRVRHRDGHYVRTRRVAWISGDDVNVGVMVFPTLSATDAPRRSRRGRR
jgi:PAS domain S-box-containing protein